MSHHVGVNTLKCVRNSNPFQSWCFRQKMMISMDRSLWSPRKQLRSLVFGLLLRSYRRRGDSPFVLFLMSIPNDAPTTILGGVISAVTTVIILMSLLCFAFYFLRHHIMQLRLARTDHPFASAAFCAGFSFCKQIQTQLDLSVVIADTQCLCWLHVLPLLLVFF